MTSHLDKVAYTAVATATGGRNGSARTDDGLLEVDLAVPEDMGGPGGGTNPEQLFAAGYAACFGGALALAGDKAGLDTSGAEITAEVSIGPVDQIFGLAVVLEVRIPDVDDETCQQLAQAAHDVCPYSNATRGNIDVEVRASVLA